MVAKRATETASRLSRCGRRAVREGEAVAPSSAPSFTNGYQTCGLRRTKQWSSLVLRAAARRFWLVRWDRRPVGRTPLALPPWELPGGTHVSADGENLSVGDTVDFGGHGNPLNAEQARDLREILDDRCERAAAFFRSQVPWHSGMASWRMSLWSMPRSTAWFNASRIDNRRCTTVTESARLVVGRDGQSLPLHRERHRTSCSMSTRSQIAGGSETPRFLEVVRNFVGAAPCQAAE